MRLIAIALLTAGFAMTAGDPANFYQWKPSELKDLSKDLSTKLDAQKLASKVLATNGNYAFQLAHREGEGLAEYHVTQSDVFFVQSGEATLVVGGEVVDGK